MAENKISEFTLNVSAELEFDLFSDYVSGSLNFDIDLLEYYQPAEWDLLSEDQKRGFLEELIWDEIRQNAFYSVSEWEEDLEYEEEEDEEE